MPRVVGLVLSDAEVRSFHAPVFIAVQLAAPLRPRGVLAQATRVVQPEVADWKPIKAGDSVIVVHMLSNPVNTAGKAREG